MLKLGDQRFDQVALAIERLSSAMEAHGLLTGGMQDSNAIARKNELEPGRGWRDQQSVVG
jgi:hypothetical protein